MAVTDGVVAGGRAEGADEPMTDLYPTKTHLALLRVVAAGKVRYYPQYGKSDGFSLDTLSDRRCSPQMAELRGAGWVSIPPKRPGDFSLLWALTDAGRAVLEEADSS